MNTARIQTLSRFTALTWRKFTVLAAVAVLIGLVLTLLTPLPVS